VTVTKESKVGIKTILSSIGIGLLAGACVAGFIYAIYMAAGIGLGTFEILSGESTTFT